MKIEECNFDIQQRIRKAVAKQDAEFAENLRRRKPLGEGDKDAAVLLKEIRENIVVKPKTRIIKASDAVEEEAQLHYDILDWCREHGWVALHGTMAKRTGRTVGELDFTLIGPGRVFFIECKDRDGKVSPDQQAMIMRLKERGQITGVVRSMREFLEIVK